MEPYNVVLFTAGYDTGGQGFRIKRAFDRWQAREFSVRSIHTLGSYFQYPADLAYHPSTAQPLFDAADVIHMRNGLEGLKRLRPAALEGRVGLICHWHGTRFRQEHAVLARETAQKGAKQLVSTVDLTLLAPDLTWLPSPIDVYEMSSYRSPLDPDNPIRVAHSPTNRVVKGTQHVMDAVQGLYRRGLAIELDLIERKPWAYVLQRKAKADIYVDQLELGYGNNALEAWAMGIPVIAGVSDPAVRDAMLERFGTLPFYEATPETLTERIAELATDSALRSHWGMLGNLFVHEFHEESKVAALLSEIYRDAYWGVH